MDSERIEKNMYQFFQIKGKTAIVTGAGNGVGKATARMFAGLGANVVGCDIEKDNVENTAKEINKEGGICIGVKCDITKDEEIKKVVNTAVENFGTVDILANVGATCGGGKTIDNMTHEEFDRLIKVNLRGVYQTIMQVLPIMRDKKYGKIISVSSGAAITGCPTDFHYAAAKGGVISMTKSLALQLKDYRINVNAVAPGLVNTRMAHEWEFEDALKRWYKVGEPEDIAAAIVFLASECANYFSGQVLSPNGGEWMI